MCAGRENAGLAGFSRSPVIYIGDRLLPSAVKTVSGAPTTRLTERELLGVMAHELGHWWHWHGVSTLVELVFYLALWTAPYYYVDAVWWLTPILLSLLMPLTAAVNLVSHRQEHQADAFAARLGRAEGLRGALVRMSCGSDALHDPLYAAYLSTHPSLVERVKRLAGGRAGGVERAV